MGEVREFVGVVRGLMGEVRGPDDDMHILWLLSGGVFSCAGWEIVGWGGGGDDSGEVY